MLAERLSIGAVIEEVELIGDRLHYKLVTGAGPADGWASLKIKSTCLVVPKELDAGGPAAKCGPVELDEDLKKQIVAAAKAREAVFGKYVPKYKVFNYPLESPKFRIFCFHCAGGAESIYTAEKFPFYDWVTATGVGEIVAVQYPGRENLLKEEKHYRLETLCPLLLSIIHDKMADGVPYFFWGHCVGTWVAFETLILARKIGLPMPRAAFLNAFPAPHMPVGERPWRRSRTLSEDELKKELQGWDETHFAGAGSVLFRDDQWPTHGPIMRADFQLYDEYKFRHNKAPKFDFPLHFWHMEQERYNKSDMIELWGEWTTANKDFRIIPFGHFTCVHVPDMRKKYQEAIVECLKDYLPNMGTSAAKAAMPDISVVLSEMNGRQHHLDVPAGATVADLKHVAYPALMVPVEFQVLIIDAVVLQDEEPIGTYVQNVDQPLMVTFCFSDGGILGHESVAARRAAIDALTKVVHGGRRQVIDVFINLCKDENDICRHAAVSALANVAHLADERFVNALVERLLDPNKLVAVTAVQALARAVESGNEEASSILLEFVECVEDQEDVMLQLAVIEACVKLPQRHYRRIVRSMATILRSSRNNRVRSAAESAASDLSRRARRRATCAF